MPKNVACSVGSRCMRSMKCALCTNIPPAAGRVEHAAVVRLDDVDDGLHQRDGREELAAVMRLLVGELGEEVLVDAAEHV